MRMKSIIATVAAMFLSLSLSAQTAEEIIDRMNVQLSRADAEGFAMDFNVKMPIIGKICSHNLIRGDKVRMELAMKDNKAITWTTSDTKWDYSPEKAEIVITSKDTSENKDDGNNLKAFESFGNGYKYKIKKETDEYWLIRCKKLKSNKVKDDPKKMYLTVAKGTYLPICLEQKGFLMTVSMENVTIGVTEAQVTFNADEFPGVTITDNR